MQHSIHVHMYLILIYSIGLTTFAEKLTIFNV